MSLTPALARTWLCAALLTLTACASGQKPPVNGGAAVRGLGEPYRTTQGEVYLIRVQDEYRLIRCIPTGPIAGCYQDVFKVSREAITDQSKSDAPYRWNQWIPVADMPGVQIMFLAPDRIALKEAPPGR